MSVTRGEATEYLAQKYRKTGAGEDFDRLHESCGGLWVPAVSKALQLMPADDAKQELRLVTLKGCRVWDPKKGKFTTLVKRLYNNWVYDIWEDTRQRKGSFERSVMRLETMRYEARVGGREAEFDVPDEEQYSTLDTTLVLEKILSGLGENARTIIPLRVGGYTVRDIEQITGINRGLVSKTMCVTQRYLNKEYRGAI